MEFLKDNYIIIALIFAALSFYVLHKGSNETAKSSQADLKLKIDSIIKNSVNQTISEMSSQFNTVLDTMKNNSSKNMKAINKEGDSIIKNLSKKYSEATEAIQKGLVEIKNQQKERGRITLETGNYENFSINYGDNAVVMGWSKSSLIES